MADFAIDPSDTRTSRPAPDDAASPGGTRRTLGTIAIGLGVAAGMAGLAEAWTGALSDAYESFRGDRNAIKIGRVADMPEIRDGVVALAPSGAPVRVIPGAPVAPTQQFAPAQASMPAAPPVPVQAASERAADVKPATQPSVAAAPAPTAPASAPRPATLVRAAEPRPAAVTGSTSPAAPVAAQLEPRPPLRPTATASATPVPLPPSAHRVAATPLPAQTAAPRVAATPMPPPAPAAQSTALRLPPTRAAQAARKPEARQAQAERSVAARTAGQSASAAPVEAQSEDRSLLGIPVPGFIPSGKDIKSGFDSIGDAITSLPKPL